jgi:hypothetical protein
LNEIIIIMVSRECKEYSTIDVIVFIFMHKNIFITKNHRNACWNFSTLLFAFHTLLQCMLQDAGDPINNIVE